MIEALDYFCGYRPVEKALRNAILMTLRDCESLREHAAEDGRVKRAEATAASCIRREAREDVSEVLDGLKSAA